MGLNKRTIIIAFLLLFLGTVSCFLSGRFIPAPEPPKGLMDLGGLSSFLENTMGGGAPFLFKAIAALCLVFIFRKNSMGTAVPLSALILMPPINGEALALPFIAVISFGPVWAAALSAVLLPFFSKIALVGILSACGLRYISTADRKASFFPLIGLLSPPMLISIFSGQLLLPFLLSACSFPSYRPVALLSPLFAVFLIGALWLFIDEKPSAAKVLLTAPSFFFAPLAGLTALFPISSDEKRNGELKFLFLVPVIWVLAFPPKNAEMPDPLKELIAPLKGTNATIAVSAQFHDEAAYLLQRPGGKGVFPEMTVQGLSSYYRLLPSVPPFLGHACPEAGLVVTGAAYPKNSSTRIFRDGWKLLWCGKEHAMFGRESFLKTAPGLKPLEYYNPYYALPRDEAGKRAALLEVEKIISQDKDFYEAQRDAGKLLLDLNEPQKAEIYLRKALDIRKTAGAYNDLGVSLANSGKPDQAMDAYVRAMELSPRDIYPRMNFASAALAAGNKEQAVTALNDIVRNYPTFYPAVRFLSQIYMKDGDTGKAAALLSMIPESQRTPEENSLAGGERK